MNPDHLSELNKGSHSWNQWRKENSNEKPDLGNTILTGFDFTGYDLSMADLSGTQLIGVNLVGVNLRNGDLKRATLFKAKLSGADLIGVDLDGADLSMADLSSTQLIGADLRKTQLVGATLNGANLFGAILSEVDLRETRMCGTNLTSVDLRMANLSGADLSGANLSKANIKGLRARFSIVDGATLLNECQMDCNTDFSGVGLDSARINGTLKAKLKRNIRQKHWDERYPYYVDWKSIPRYTRLIPKYLYRMSKLKYWRSIPEITWSCLVRLFWWSSDYGSAGTRIILSFLIVSVVFTLIYLSPIAFRLDASFIQGIQFAEIINSSGESTQYSFNLWGIFLRAFYFSVVTMTTLGFGDISANPASPLGHFLVMFQVLIGYILLGAFITRLSILFQDVG